MKNTWASGSIELLNHADERIILNGSFNKRIALICIDCAIETAFRTYISLPQSKSGIKVPYKEVEDAGNSFPKITDLVFKYAKSKLYGVDSTDIEYYHRIRNQLYHNGTGLSVDENTLNSYRQIANVVLQNLFDIDIPDPTDSITLENLVVLWNMVQKIIKNKMKQNGIDDFDTFKWEVAERRDVLSKEIITKYSELGIIRNYMIHKDSVGLEKNKLKYGIELANEIINELKKTY